MDSPAPDAPPAASSRKLPWYSFLYALLGAQGTFWLWIVTVVALWWTAEPALIRLVNRHPRPLQVSEVKDTAGTLTRWVQLQGLELSLDWRLLAAPQRQSLPPVVLLIDAKDPAAIWWGETYRVAQLALAEVAPGDAEAEQARAAARGELQRRYTELIDGQDTERLLPAPEDAVLVLDARTPSLQDVGPPEPPAPRDGDGSLLADYQRELLSFAELVVQRVRPDVPLQGLLNDTPQVVLDRLQKELDLHPSPWLIQVGREPRDVESVVFGAAAIVLIFLATGLYGASRVRTPAAEPEEAA